MSKNNPFILVILASVLSWYGCGDDNSKQDKMAEPTKTNGNELRVGVMPTMDCLPIYLLVDSAMYDTTMVKITLKEFSAQMDCDTALIGGSVHGSVTDLLRVENMRKKGVPLKNVTSTDLHWQLIASKKARLNELSQFGDKMVAMTRFSATDYLTDRAIKKGKPKNPVYKVQINDVGIRHHMMLNNELDAAWMPEPYATSVRMQGNNVVSDTRKDSIELGVVAFRVVALADDVKYKQVEEFLKAYDKAVDEINKKGIKYYSNLIKKYMGVGDDVVAKLPNMKYNNVREPNEQSYGKRL